MTADPAMWIDLSALMTGTNMQLLTAVSVLTFILYRIEVVPNKYADLVPFALGAALGLRSGIEAGFSLFGYSLAGACINGAAAWVVARIGCKAWQELVNKTSVPAAPAGGTSGPSPLNGKAKEQ